MQSRVLDEAYEAFCDIYNLVDRYHFWGEDTIRSIHHQFDEEMDWAQAHFGSSCPVIKGMDAPDPGYNVSIIVGNFAKSCYIPFIAHQLVGQHLDPTRFEVVFIDSARDPAFLPVISFCRQKWPSLDIRAFETHEDRCKTVTLRRNVGARQAKYEHLIIFDSDWLPIGRNCIESLLRASAPNRVVRGTCFAAQDGGQTFGRWLRGPESWFHSGKTDWQIHSPPKVHIYNRNDHDFLFSIPKALYHAAGGFPEYVVGGGGIEGTFFQNYLQGYETRWAIDAVAINLNTFPTFTALENCHPWTLVPATGFRRNSNDWGMPSELEDLTSLL